MLDGTFALLIAVAASLVLHVMRRRTRIANAQRRIAIERVRYFERHS